MNSQSTKMMIFHKERFPQLRLALKGALGYRRRIKYHNNRINHIHQCIFVHIPKTAGSSVTNALNAVSGPAEQKSPKIGKHAKAYEIKFLLGKDLWERYFTFTFVRNPWDLMVSSYHWWLQKAPQLPPHRRRAERVKRMSGFSEFIQSDLGRYMINERHGNLFDWITENDKIIVDYVGKVETIDRDWKIICEQIGMDAPAIPHINKTARKGYRDYYTPETKKLVAYRFQKSIELFNYDF